MQNYPHNLKRLMAVLTLATLLVTGCRTPYCAYRARILGGPVPLGAAPQIITPTPPVVELPQTSGEHSHVPIPEPGGPRPLIPATPQPALPSIPPTAAQSNFPPPALPNAGIVLHKVGPSQAALGALVTYRLEIQAASAGARDVTVYDQLSAGLTYASSNPIATVVGNQLEWKLGDLRGGELRTIEVNFRAEQLGAFNNCAVARTADGQSSQDCLNTAVGASDLEVRVNVAGSDNVLVGDRVTFQITVTNRSALPVAGLMITDAFGAGLEHEAAASPIEKDLGELAGGQSTTLGVTFRVVHAGRLCNRVEVRSTSGAGGSADACVTAMLPGAPPAATNPEPPLRLPPPPTGSIQNPNQGTFDLPSRGQPPVKASLDVKVTGPDAPQQIDAVADLGIEVFNTGEGPLTNLTVTVEQDKELYPVQATSGYQWTEGGQLYWKIPSLAAGKSASFKLNARCQKLGARACTRVTVTSAESATDEAEACLQIGNSESLLELSVNDLSDPVVAGKPLTYEIQVVNKGSAPARNVALLVVAPPELAVQRLGTTGERTTYEIDNGRNVRFKPIAELLPGEKLTFRVRVNTQKAGEVSLEALLKSDGMAQPLTEIEKTTVID